MKTKIIIFLFCFIIISYYRLSGQEVEKQISIEPKTINRTEDPIIIQGKNLSSLLGERIANLNLYAIKDNKLDPIPFQIDERNKKGDFVFDFVFEQGKYATEDDDKGLLDSNDELVFMSKDLGDKTSKDFFPIDYLKSIEIEATDPLTKNKGWVYLLSFSNESNHSNIDYIKVYENENKIETINYIMGFSTQSPIYNYLSISNNAGGTMENIMDRLKMRLHASFFFGTIKVNRDEEDFTSERVAYIDGSVRAIVRSKNTMKILAQFQSPSVSVDSIFYSNHMSNPMILHLPISPDLVLTDIYLIATTDFNKNATGSIFYSNSNPEGVLVDGNWSDKEDKLNFGPAEWIVVSGKQGTWMSRTTYGPEVPIIKKLYYMDSIKKLDPPENEAGQIGSSGFNLTNIHKVKRGVVQWITYVFIPANFKKGDEVKYNNIIDHPLEIKIN